MPELESILAELQSRGSGKTRATYVRHGMPAGRVYGVSVADLKTIAKSIKRQQDLALALYASGMMEAMYLAGMVADGAGMTREQLQSWAEGSGGISMIAEHTVPWVTVENPLDRELATQWIASEHEHVATSGWCTWSGLVATRPDSELGLAEIESLLESIPSSIATAKNRVRYTMNGFVISVGHYVEPLLGKAEAIAQQLGAVTVDCGDTDCKVPLATEYIAKAVALGRIGQKRKTIRC